MATYETVEGDGGELHQRVPAGGPHDDPAAHLTTNHGVRVADNQNQLKAGARGPVLLEDFVLREKIFHFDHERIPERIVHARGSGAHGFFEVTHDISHLTRARLFSEVGKKTPVFTRFSTVAGGAGSVDTPRDVRGFAVKFYTEEGNWDLVGNNIPVFFIQDAIKFPDLIHAAKMEAKSGYPQAATAHDTFWDYISLTPEASHMVMWIMSDRTLPRSFATMQGFGIHTFQLINAEGQVSFVKFHWKPKAGLQSTIWDETVKIAGADPDYQRRDLFERIDLKNFPEWELGIQVFDKAFADSQPYDVLDSTKIIPEEVLPVQPVGRMVLNRYPDNFFAEVEQVAYCPSHIVPGIGFSNDPLLHGRLFSYLDTQRSRFNTSNFHLIPINAAKSPTNNFQRDGFMQTNVCKGRANYEPNGLQEGDEMRPGDEPGPRECPETGYQSYTAFTGPDEEGAKLRIRAESFADHYSQARLFFRSQSAAEQAHIASALVFELSKVGLAHVRKRMLSNLVNIDPALAQRVADGIGMDVPAASATKVQPIDMEPSPALRIIDGPLDRGTVEGRSIAILIADGSSAQDLGTLKKRIKRAGARAVVVGPKVNVTMDDGTRVPADAQLAGYPSVFADAVALLLSDDGAAALTRESAAIQFVMDAFGHCKAIGTNRPSRALLRKAGIEPDAGVTRLQADFFEAAGKRFYEREPKVRTLA